ncbi:DNA polymerase III subunit alpha [Candidatus Kuenenbacteria bacterium HGW-Kuenenbacteria-1]|uniref:DNA-directed DNA polymerase n=1 Tax=Candidatus Kuenenbacteria bacterium HGW-Kuenenbacteria-1 TaxID=2013812 RepID=A0A2N1UNR0_9BACT|nr:MAG: DNA polymerase III subunit alpha [Candidatus Kuenenbacteria bacterium HGW-Kuenenbacteria-1]
MLFSHLHIHSHYSLLDGLPKIDELLEYAKKLNMNSLALTDHGNMYGVIEFYQKAKAQGIKPIIGVEFYVATDGMYNKRPNIDNKQYHLVLLAKNLQGYKNLIKLTSKAWLEGYYYKPRIDNELLKKHSEGLIALSGCLKGAIPQTILAENYQKAEKIALEYQKLFGKDSFYLELQDHPSLSAQITVNQKIIEMAKKLNIPLIATNDVHYLQPEDAEAQDILICLQTQKKIADTNRMTFVGEDFSMRSQEQMIDSFKDVPEAIENTQKIVELCNLEIPLKEILLPHFDVPKDFDANTYLEKLCYQGLKEKFPQCNEEILSRLKYELDIIKTTGFASYFLIVQDFVNWAKKNEIFVGPGRGSAPGSLVSYVLNITEINPIKYNLLFERFLNPERISMPDIDLDFADDRRNEVIGYIEKKYGKNHVAQIATFGTMAGRASIRDCGRVLGIEYSLCDKIAKLILGHSIQDSIDNVSELKEFFETDPKIKRLLEISKKLEGVARHISTHACGIIITKNSLNNYVPLQHPHQDDETIVTQYSMNIVENLGLLKIDILGLKNLTILQKTIKLIKWIHNIKIDLNQIPLDNKKTFKLFKDGKTTGVFQLESSGMKKYLKQLKPNNFEDIIAMISLYRPGPIEWIPDYINGKHGKKKTSYLHPKLESILEKTYGICIYQEQVMEIAKTLAGFTLAEADILRKAVGKKIHNLLIKQKEKFIKGCVANKISQEIANKVFVLIIEPFAGYGFNKSHGTCYALIGYWTAYLKAHFPCEFMASLLTSDQGNADRIAIEIMECKEMGIKVLPPDINESFADFTVIVLNKQQIIRFGLSAIKNVGKKIIEAIIEERKKNGKFESMENFMQRVNHKDLNKKSLESLIKCGTFDQLGERIQFLENLEEILNYGRKINKENNSNQINLFDILCLNTLPKLNLKTTELTNEKQNLTWEKELLGLYVSKHPFEKFKLLFNFPIYSELKKVTYKNNFIQTAGLIAKIQKVYTRQSKELMLFVTMEDGIETLEILVFPTILKNNSEIWQENKMILIQGKLSDKDGNIKLIADEAKEITEENIQQLVKKCKNFIYEKKNYREFSSRQLNSIESKEQKNCLTQPIETFPSVCFNISPATDQILIQKLKNILINCPGKQQVYFNYVNNGQSQKIYTNLFINFNEEIKEEIKKLKILS